MRLRGAMIHSVLQQNGGILIAFATGIVTARILSPREVGVYSVAMAAVSVAVALKDFGVAAYVVSEPDDDGRLLRSGFGVTLAISGLLTIALLASGPAAAHFYRDPKLQTVLCARCCRGSARSNARRKVSRPSISR